jgi:release factor glutamine methyltransferase
VTNARDMLDVADARIAAAGCEDPQKDALALVAKVLEMTTLELSDDGDTPVSVQERRTIEELIERRENREPLAYVVGLAPFRGLEIAVDERVLWPRP